MLRFLELLSRELGADDARLELGGDDPEDARLVFANLPDSFRLVAVFAQPPSDPDQKRARLLELASGFSETLARISTPVPPSAPLESAFQRLDAALEGLRSRVGAVSVVVVDSHSPVLWGTSDARRPDDDAEASVQVGQALGAALAAGIELDAVCALPAEHAAMRLRALGVADESARALAAGLEGRDESVLRHHLLTCLALSRARADAAASQEPLRTAHHEPQFGYFARGFANIYVLLAVFEGAFSELTVEAGVLHALPAIEQLVLALPPLDPEPAANGGRVIRLRHKRA